MRIHGRGAVGRVGRVVGAAQRFGQEPGNGPAVPRVLVQPAVAAARNHEHLYRGTAAVAAPRSSRRWQAEQVGQGHDAVV